MLTGNSQLPFVQFANRGGKIRLFAPVDMSSVSSVQKRELHHVHENVQTAPERLLPLISFLSIWGFEDPEFFSSWLTYSFFFFFFVISWGLGLLNFMLSLVVSSRAPEFNKYWVLVVLGLNASFFIILQGYG